MAWNVSGRFIEGCSCNVMCPCWFGVKELMVMDQGYCAINQLYLIEQGNSDGIDLSGRTVVQAAYAPGPTLLDGNLTLRIYIDDGASAEQHRELEGIFSGAKGGPMEVVASLVTEVLPTQAVGIQVKEDGNDLSITIGSYGTVESHALNDDQERPVVIQNAMFARTLGVSDPQVAPAGHRWSDPEMPRVFDTISGARATFAWSGG